MDISDDQWRGADSPDSETGLEPEDAEAGEAGLSQQEDYRLVLDIDDEEEDSITIPDADEDNATESAASSTVPDKSASKKKKSQMTDFFSRCGTNANGESSTNPPAGELQVGHNKNTRNNNKKRVHENQREKPSGSKQPAQEPASNLCSKLDISEADMKIIAGEAVVWQYYTRVFEDGKKLAKCNECGVVRSIPSGTTTTLTFHLKKHFKCKREYDRLQALRKKLEEHQKLMKSGKGKKIYTIKNMLKQDYMDPKSKKAVEITHAIAIWICKNLHAYSTVEEKEFVALINLLEPRYKVPCRTTFSRSIILKLYNSLKAKEAAYFKIVKDKLESINATIDMWTSDTAKDSYISLTVQFVDPECEQVSFSVECEPFPGVHSGTTVLQKVEWMLAEKLGLEPEIVDQPEIYITADNGPNIAAALAEPTEQKLLDPKVPAELKKKRMWFYIRCLNHTLQLVISDARKEMNAKTVIEKVQNIAVRYSRSKNAREDLRKFQSDHKLPQHTILLDCETRWNSEYLMLERFLEQKAAIISELAHAGEESLTVQDWGLIDGYVQVLKPIFDHTAQLGSSTEVTFSTVIPVLFEIKSSLEDFIRKAKKGTGVMFARKVLSKLEERFPDCDYKDNELYQTGMVVDPRFKDILISSFDGDKTAHFLLERKALEKHRRHIRRGWVRMEETNSEEQVTAAASPKTIKKSRFSHFAKVGQNKSDTSTTADVITSIRNEVESYLQLKTEDEDCDPLEWWKQHKNDFPHIYPLARHYLGLCPTEVPSERMFSVGGNTCTKKRSRLLPDHVKEIIYIHDNYDMLMRLSKIYDLK